MQVDESETQGNEETVDNMQLVEEEEEDPMKVSFDAIDANASLKSESKVIEYLKLLQTDRSDDIAVKIKEQSIYKLAQIHTESKSVTEVMNLLKSNNDFFSLIPKARTAKIVRNILGIVSKIPDSLDIQTQLCKDVIEWCKLEKRTFLRQRVEAKLANLFLQQKDASAALLLINSLLTELKKLDDKQMLTEVHLTESRIYHTLENVPKAKASLTASRSAANSIYVSPLLQAEIDEMSGILHCEEGDHVTAYSYFLEAFEAYDHGNDKIKGMTILKYMLLTKVLANLASDVPNVLAGKLAMKYKGIDIDAMVSIANAAKTKSLEDFTENVKKYDTYLRSDALISHQLDDLYQKMLELNLLKIVHPYSCVEIAHVAKLIKLPVVEVERKLSQMILDHRFSGILDQGKGHLIIYENSSEDKAFTKGLEVIHNMSQVVDALFVQAKQSVHKTA